MTAPTRIDQLPDLSFELGLHDQGLVCVAGVDEAGRGALAGPVVASAVVLPIEQADLSDRLGGVRDSKLMSPRARRRWARVIVAVARGVSVGMATPAEVDQLGLIAATRLAMGQAIAALPVEPDHLLLDYMFLPELVTPQTSLVHGDARVLSISAASVVAKVTRDQILCDLDSLHPGYGLAAHKGYATPEHLAALRKLGPCPAHRHSYAPVAECSGADA